MLYKKATPSSYILSLIIVESFISSVQNVMINQYLKAGICKMLVPGLLGESKLLAK